MQPFVDYTTFATTKRYTWDLGNGQKLGGTLAELVYRYKKSGRYEIFQMWSVIVVQNCSLTCDSKVGLNVTEFVWVEIHKYTQSFQKATVL